MEYALILLQCFLLVYMVRKLFKKNPFSFFLFAVVYHLVFLVLSLLITINSNLLVRDKLKIVDVEAFSLYTFMFTCCLCAFYYIRKKLRIEQFNYSALSDVSRVNRLFIYLLFWASGISILAYGASTGFGSSMGDYEARYEQTRGLGALYLFMPFFVPYFFWKIWASAKTSAFWLYSVSFVGFGLLVFLFTVGLRFYLLLSIVCVTLTMYHTGRIKFRTMLALICLFPFVVGGLAMMRYGYSESSSGFAFIPQLLLFLQGDIFPVDAFYNIYGHCSSAGGVVQCPGTILLENQLLRMVPRVLWEEKPDIMLSGSAYYTQFVVGSLRELTLSPTIFGEGILVSASSAGILIYYLAAISVLVVIDFGIFRYPTFAIVLSGFFPKVFDWHRGGFSLFLYWLITVLVVFCLFYALSRLIDIGLRDSVSTIRNHSRR